ncbi:MULTISPECIES: hypothetical protein [unclassified Paenibacillus]|uniref:hypothetical protein n=1 Tax=unclassified Paenibacillus TaxID=185978 RepID=UPI0027853EAD|nr:MULTISPECIES: hypothetical protein [unclassified Paenibacillus]MDQ0899251.1 hypothetical protein [Paenibacillus sp. V4I7]MDQ0914759.1 hypothetical protein [Paenibacillus sp. V4I5]
MVEDPVGLWKQYDRQVPVLDVCRDASASDLLVVTNPCVTAIRDGRILMILLAMAILSSEERIASCFH